MAPKDLSLLEVPLLGLDPLQMFDSFKNFKPVRDYQRKDRRLFEYGRGLQIPSETFGLIIMMDYMLRAARQWEEHIKVDLTASEKSTDGNKNMRDKYEEDFECVEIMIWLLTKELHNLEILLPQRPLKETYDKIRQNPAWYLRKELVHDCANRGGCCGRSCGCCKKRCLTSKEKGTGHCTERCFCCRVNSG